METVLVMRTSNWNTQNGQQPQISLKKLPSLPSRWRWKCVGMVEDVCVCPGWGGINALVGRVGSPRLFSPQRVHSAQQCTVKQVPKYDQRMRTPSLLDIGRDHSVNSPRQLLSSIMRQEQTRESHWSNRGSRCREAMHLTVDHQS